MVFNDRFQYLLAVGCGYLNKMEFHDVVLVECRDQVHRFISIAVECADELAVKVEFHDCFDDIGPDRFALCAGNGHGLVGGERFGSVMRGSIAFGAGRPAV